MNKIMFYVFGSFNRFMVLWFIFVGIVVAVHLIFNIEPQPFSTFVIAVPMLVGFLLGPKYTTYTNDFSELEQFFVNAESRMPQKPEEVAKEVTEILKGKRGGYVWGRFYTDPKYYEKFGARWKTLLAHIASKGSELTAKTLTDFLSALCEQRDTFTGVNSKQPMVDVLKRACDSACHNVVQRFNAAVANLPGQQMNLENYLKHVIRYDWAINNDMAAQRLFGIMKESKDTELIVAFLYFDDFEPEFRNEIGAALRRINNALKQANVT